MPTNQGPENYEQKRLAIRRSVERVCEKQTTRVLMIGKGDTHAGYTPEELIARHRRKRLGPELTYEEFDDLDVVYRR